jgi:hypothetical protein
MIFETTLKWQQTFCSGSIDLPNDLPMPRKIRVESGGKQNLFFQLSNASI